MPRPITRSMTLAAAPAEPIAGLTLGPTVRSHAVGPHAVGPRVIVDPETLDAARTLLTLKNRPNTTQYQWTHDDRQITGNAVQ